jgi:dihydrofolate reductase
MKLTIIVAVSENGIIGRAGDLPWHISADLKRFKRITMGHCLLMGRKTFDSVGRPLPGRRTVILTHDRDLSIEGAHVVHGFEEAVSACEAAQEDEVFVVGGAEIYRLALPKVEKVHLTRVHCVVQGDASFPELSKREWQLEWEEAHEAESEGGPAFTFQLWQRATSELGSGH